MRKQQGDNPYFPPFVIFLKNLLNFVYFGKHSRVEVSHFGIIMAHTRSCLSSCCLQVLVPVYKTRVVKRSGGTHSHASAVQICAQSSLRLTFHHLLNIHTMSYWNLALQRLSRCCVRAIRLFCVLSERGLYYSRAPQVRGSNRP